MTYAGQERQWREEELDWLHQHHEQLVEQTELMRRQAQTLERIAQHTNLIYVVTILWLVLGGICLLVYLTAGL